MRDSKRDTDVKNSLWTLREKARVQDFAGGVVVKNLFATQGMT